MDLLAALARQRAGLRIESDKAYLVESRLNPWPAAKASTRSRR
jgi:chemotaxis protein methyltransferase CheR